MTSPFSTRNPVSVRHSRDTSVLLLGLDSVIVRETGVPFGTIFCRVIGCPESRVGTSGRSGVLEDRRETCVCQVLRVRGEIGYQQPRAGGPLLKTPQRTLIPPR